jgi:predicted HTH domain antitoxin
MGIMVEIPDDLEVILKIDKKDIPKAVKLYLAIELYRERKISLGKASEIAGISKEEMMKVLSRKGIPISYDIDDLKEDIKRLECLL